ncbi:MAG: 2-amino-4-hydroxy-6-hydroxymethyldihydropteridine diphosphokinase [Prevotella sp.]|nr:2-amino-4-hydroxy-6-hydroxymethyldihydropteridine diphosphokinase [Prevotella sp.]MDD7461608.1 2-amino-4-hydroxy-6-hydroxymethyldihydropteridine diphosphokinase [Prevotellaceae bacterium]MDY3365183.1 2-amino-4-hydroxy-6-hydroxymethyldihydropteridine diphosphokinase [Prevotella sp.]
MSHIVYFSLGANIGDKKLTILRAIDRIGELIGGVERRSALYETQPWGFTSSHSFLNAAVCCCTKLNPREVLAQTQLIEKELGRTIKSVDGQYQDRVIDIDILLYDDWQIDEDDLKIPHPLMYERDFVMTPLREIMADGGEGW